MRVSIRSFAAALLVLLGLFAFAAPASAQGISGGGIAIRDHGGGYGGYRSDFRGERRGYRGSRHYRGHSRGYRHGRSYRDRRYYNGRRHHDRRYHSRQHRRHGGGSVVIRLR